jgi:hypothetical protein
MKERIMVRHVLNLLVAGAIVLGGLGASAPLAANQGGESWRFRVSEGRWWYWMPEGRWVYWQDGRWNDYRTPTVKFASRDGVGVSTPSGEAQSPCIPCSLTVAPGNAINAGAGSEARIYTAAYAETSRLFQGNSGGTLVGPLYGKAQSLTEPHVASTYAEPGPFYDHAGSLFDTAVDRSLFLGY